MEWILYLCSVSGNIKTFLGIFTIIALILFIIGLLYSLETVNTTEALKENLKFLYVSLLSALLCALIPSTKECYLILGVSSVVEYCTSSEEVKKLTDNAIKALDEYLESIQQDELEVTIKGE